MTRPTWTAARTNDSDVKMFTTINHMPSPFGIRDVCILTQVKWFFGTLVHHFLNNSQSLLKLMPIELVMPSSHFILCRPLLLLPSIFPRIRVFSNTSFLCIRQPNYSSFSFSISPSNEYSGLISFRIDWFDLLQSKGFSRVFSNTTVQKHQCFGAQISLQKEIPAGIFFGS